MVEFLCFGQQNGSLKTYDVAKLSAEIFVFVKNSLKIQTDPTNVAPRDGNILLVYIKFV